jgi:hypothetical protein
MTLSREPLARIRRGWVADPGWNDAWQGEEKCRGFRYEPSRATMVLRLAPPPRPQTEDFTGIVDAVRDGVGYLTITDRAGREIEIEWDAADLQSRSIEEGHYFHLTTTTRGEDMVFEFRPVTPKPLPEESRREIEDLLSRYRDRGLLDDDGP